MVQLSPGVQVIEKDYTQIAPSLSTTIGAFAGVFKWGPVESPVAISSETDLVNVFGQPDDTNYTSFFTAKNFLEYSNRMYVARVDTAGAANAVAIPTGGIESIDMVLHGSGYTSAPSVVIEAPEMEDGVAAVAEARLSGGSISSYTVVSGGTGYSVGDLIAFSDPEVPYEVIVNGEVQSTEIRNAKAKVSAVDPSTSAITAITFVGTGLTSGDGYLDGNSVSVSIFNSSGTAPSAGTGANLSFTATPSSVKSIVIIDAGSGYTESQMPVSVSIAAPVSGVTATATATVDLRGARIKNETNYEAFWSEGQGAYGEFAAKYMGTLGNSLLVSMCDANNWSTNVNGLFYARKSIESFENTRELSLVRRVLDNEDEFSNEAIDAGKVLRSSDSAYIGVVKNIVSGTFRKIRIAQKSRTANKLALGTHIYQQGYGTLVAVSSVARTSAGIVTITTAGNHGLNAGQRVSVLLSSVTGKSAAIVKQLIVKNAEILSVTNTTLTYKTSAVGTIPATSAAGSIKSTSMGQIDGFVKVFNRKTDHFEISTLEYIVTEFNSNPGNAWAVNQALFDTLGNKIGVIEHIDEVQTIQLVSTSAVDVYGSSVTSEWKYKSLFNSNAPSTSPYAAQSGGANDELHVVVIDADGKITGEAGNVIEKFEDLSKASDAKNLTSGQSIYYKKVINERSAWIWILDHTKDIDGLADWGTPARNHTFTSMTNAVTRRLSKGGDTVNPSASNYIDSYSLYDDSAKFDISLVPFGHLDASLVSTITQEVIEKRKDCVAFVSAPLQIGSSADIVANVISYRNSLPDSSYLVLDSGWKYQYDKYSDKFRWIPLSGDIAGLCAYTEQVADAWYSPGGFNRGQIKNVIKLAFNPTQLQRDELYTNGVNPVVSFPGEGTILFGDKTLQRKASAFDRINVRRLFIVLEKTVSIASKYQLFEFNDDFTRSQFKGIVEPFLRDVQGRRGITDFLVKCDTSNNTPSIIDANQFVADIYVKPARSINFITLNFIATKTGVSFEEVGA